jgi:(5-formylfuran-3-yl)methyl phosphate synthase
MEIIEQLLRRDRPGLLVSVRNADEAIAALAGGTDVIDVKEPNRGALGAADYAVIAEIVRAVNGRAPVTAAAGELVDLLPKLSNNSCAPMPAGVSLAKIGLSHCGTVNNWKASWQQVAETLQGNRKSHTQPVAVVYADWEAAASPPPDEIHSSALDIGCRVVLIDTWNKTSGSLFDHWPIEELRFFVDRVRRSGKFAVVLAGSLTDANLLRAAELQPNLIAVRGAACDSGRNSSVSQKRVSNLRTLLDSVSLQFDWHETRGSHTSDR